MGSSMASVLPGCHYCSDGWRSSGSPGLPARLAVAASPGLPVAVYGQGWLRPEGYAEAGYGQGWATPRGAGLRLTDFYFFAP